MKYASLEPMTLYLRSNQGSQKKKKRHKKDHFLTSCYLDMEKNSNKFSSTDVHVLYYLLLRFQLPCLLFASDRIKLFSVKAS